MISRTIRTIIPSRFRPIGYLTELTRRRTNFTVASGPLQGMIYGDKSFGSVYLPKLLGIYERELAHCISNILTMKPSLIIDIGAAEGYYAVGLARLLPNTQFIAYEMNDDGRSELERNSATNGVIDRIHIRAKCEQLDLSRDLNFPSNNTVIICDVEGYECSLLDPAEISELENCSILVETHDFLAKGTTETLIRRFSPTHVIETISQQPRTHSDFPYRTLITSIIPRFYLNWAVSECRPGNMTWLWMTPNTGR